MAADVGSVLMRMLGRWSPQLYGLLRITAGILFAIHGAQKLLGVFGGSRVALMSQFGLLGVIELVCGTLIAIGSLTSVAALIASGATAAAYFSLHWPRGPVPTQNGGEVVVLYCALFLYIASRGTVALGVRK